MLQFHWFSFSDAGFDNAFVFKNITDEHINQIDRYIRDESLNVRSSNLSESFGCDPEQKCDVLLDETDMIDIFGKKYAATPSKFKFHPGEIMLIRELVKHVKEIVDQGGENKGLHHFKERKRRAKPTDTTHAKRKIVNENTVPFEHKVKSKTLTITEAGIKLNDFELKSKLFSMCSQYFQLLDVDKQVVAQFNESMIDLQSKRGAVYGIITCILCENDDATKKKKKNTHSVRYYESPNSKYWILSNFKKHLENTHNLVSIQADLRTKKNRQQRLPLKERNEVNDLKDDTSIEYIEVPIINSQKDAANSITISSIGSVNDWMYTQLSKQISDMVGAVLVNSDVTNNMPFVIANQTEMLTAAKIIPDGNCLPGAICHQLFHDPVGSTEHRHKMKKLRANVVEYILKPENFPAFEHTLKNRVYDIKKKCEISDMTQECKLFVRHCLSKDRYWAGHEFIVAAANILRVNIFVFHENGDFYLTNSGKKIHDKSITLGYRLNYDQSEYNHYESVCDMDSNLLYEVVEKIKAKSTPST